MNTETENEYKKTIAFWNEAQQYTAEDFGDDLNREEDWKAIGSESLFRLMSEAVKGWDNVLDYGCGTGWMDVILAKAGAKHIKAVDVAEQAVASARLYAGAFDSAGAVDYEAIDVNWLGNAPACTYDCAVCCNVLDVIPTEVSESIIANLARVCRPGARVLITLNPYFTEAMRSREGTEYRDPYLYVNGILRVNNHTDEEWHEMLSKHFEIEGLDHFRWDAESRDLRRFFRLRVR